MVELRDGARLAAEALQLIGVGGDLTVHELDRDGPFEDRVEGPVDGRHATAADLGIESVAPAEERPHEAHRPYCARSAADRPCVGHWASVPSSASGPSR